MAKILYNGSYGGFGLSHDAIMLYAELKGITLYVEESELYNSYYTVPVEEYYKIHKECKRDGNYTRANELHFSEHSIPRTDPILVQVVETLGPKRASSRFADIHIHELPEGARYRIEEYDGRECVVTPDEYEWSVA